LGLFQEFVKKKMRRMNISLRPRGLRVREKMGPVPTAGRLTGEERRVLFPPYWIQGPNERKFRAWNLLEKVAGGQ
jgi:hypothetical protein